MNSETLYAYHTVYDTVKQMACKIHKVVVSIEARLIVHECKKKECRLEEQANRLHIKAEKLCCDAEAKNCMTLVTEAKSLRPKRKLKRKALDSAKKEAEFAEKRLKLIDKE